MPLAGGGMGSAKVLSTEFSLLWQLGERVPDVDRGVKKDGGKLRILMGTCGKRLSFIFASSSNG